VGEVVDGELARGEVVNDEPRYVPRHPDARRRQSSRLRVVRRADTRTEYENRFCFSTALDDLTCLSSSRLILMMKRSFDFAQW
jgi:hypothetical protein